MEKGGWGSKSSATPKFVYKAKDNTSNKEQKEDDIATANTKAVKNIEGLIYVPNFITEKEEQMIVKNIDSADWSTELKRRVQQYGYTFSYASQQVDITTKTEPMPSWLEAVRKRLVQREYFPVLPDQLIVNEYNLGQGINPHVDKTHCFDESVASISLLSPCVMNFSNTKTLEKVDVLLERRSLVVLKGKSRYNWTHGITKRDIDTFAGKEIQRERRLSLTYRIMIQEYLKQQMSVAKA